MPDTRFPGQKQLFECRILGFRRQDVRLTRGLSQITRYTVRRLPLIMDVRMYDNGYVRLTALPTGILLFPQRFASALPPLKG